MGGELRVIKVLRNGKRRYDPEDKERLIEACLAPGVSLARLALEQGVNANQLRNWVTLRRRQAAQASGVTRGSEPVFIPVVEAGLVISPPGNAAQIAGRREAPAGSSRPRSSRTRLKVTMANGVRLELEGGDAQLLSAMIEALGQCDVPAGG
jgi:transposase